MLQPAISRNRIAKLNQRQRKKLHVAEFQEFLFHVQLRFRQAMDESAYDAWLDSFISFIEARKLLLGAMGGSLPLNETDGIIQRMGRGSPSQADRQAVLDWLIASPEVASASADELIDAWYAAT